MKKYMFLVFTLCSSMAIACGEDEIQSVGGSIADSNEVSQNGKDSSGLVGTEGCPEDYGKITVTGFSYFSIPRLVIGITYALGYSGGGGGGGFIANSTDGCNSLSLEEREDAANLAFGVASAQAAAEREIGQFCMQYHPGSIYTHEFPNGDTADYTVYSCMASRPLSAEVPNTCG